MMPEASSILDSLCRTADERMGVKFNTTRGKLSARISVDLQRGFHTACALQWAHQASSEMQEDIVIRHLCGPLVLKNKNNFSGSIIFGHRLEIYISIRVLFLEMEFLHFLFGFRHFLAPWPRSGWW